MISLPNFKSSGNYFMQLATLLIIIFFTQICFGQKCMRTDQENFLKLKDDVIKREIATFSINGSSLIKADSLFTIRLQEIPLKKCSDSFVFFEKGNIYKNELMIDIMSTEEVSQTRIKEIRLLYGRYGLLLLPDSVLADIYVPKFCDRYTKKGKPIKSNCKVFCSEDRRRVYIDMLNGEGSDRYEVTWVIQDGKYHTRVLDPI